MEEELLEYNNLFLQFPYLDYTKLKEKQSRMLIHIISKSRLSNKMKFVSYGTFETNENGQYANVKSQNDFSRKDTKCMIFEIQDAEKYGYDTLIIFMHKVHESTYYDYIVYNSISKQCTGHFYKNPDISAIQDTTLPSNVLLTDINISFNRMESSIRINNMLREKKLVD